jgi:RNAse (barnase) inhibitor barstar
MTALGREDGEALVVDLRGQTIETWPQLWDALASPCGLPSWFGRNLNAWWDTIQTGAISEVLDDHPMLIVLVRQTGLFAPGGDGQGFLDTTNQCDYARAEASPP